MTNKYTGLDRRKFDNALNGIRKGSSFVAGFIGGAVTFGLIPITVFICLTTTEAEVLAKVDAVLAWVGR